MAAPMTIVGLMKGADQAVFYDDGFRAVLEDALSWLVSHPLTKIQVVETEIAYRFESDFWSVCNWYNVPYQLHWLVMRMTGLESPMEWTREGTGILLPDPNTVQQILSNYNSAHA